MRLRAPVRCLVPTLALSLIPRLAPASQTPVSGTLVVAHGGSDEWNERVLTVARCAQTGGPVEVAFLMGPAAAQHRFQDQVAKLRAAGATSAVVVPLLVSSHSGHYEQIRYLSGKADSLDAAMHHHLHMAGLDRPSAGIPITVAPALDDAPELAEVLATRALALTQEPAQRALYLVGHGPNSAEDHAAWMENLRRVADSVQRRTGFASVAVGVVRDDAPPPVRAEAVRAARELIVLQAKATGRDVIVVPVLISRGAVGNERIRGDLAGLPVVYSAEPVLPHPAIARWIERVATAKPLGGGAARTCPSSVER